MGVRGLTNRYSLSSPGVKTSIVVPIAGSISCLGSELTLITNECFSKLKLKYTKLKKWRNKITILNEKILNKSMIDKKKLRKRRS